MYKMNTKEQKFLLEFGYTERDFKQIEEAKRKTIYTGENDKKLTQKEVIKILGLREYLSGLSRSAFHWSSFRSGIYFDSSKLFE